MTTGTRASFWRRFGRALRGKSVDDEPENRLPRVGDDGLLADPVETPDEEEFDSGVEKAPARLVRWTKRDQTLAKLQEGYEQVTRLIDETQKHLAEQGQRTERICTSLEKLAKSIGDLPASTARQVEGIEAIASQMEVASARTQEMAASLGELPKVARMQSETLVSISQQLQVTTEQNVVTGQTMDKLSQAINLVGESSRTQNHTLAQMNAKTTEQNDLLADLVARQSRRFLMLFIVMLVLVAAAITLGVLVMIQR